MDSNYTRIFIGNTIAAKRISNQLEEMGINPIIKNEAESARLAGFAPSMLNETEIYVHNDELEKAKKVIHN